jgi:hypothetical protein
MKKTAAGHPRCGKRLILGILAVLFVIGTSLAGCENKLIIDLMKYKDEEERRERERGQTGGGTPSLPALTGTVTVTGNPDAVGQTLTANTAFLGGSGAVSYRWGRGTALNGPFTDISPAATAATYILQAADNGTYIAVTVTRAGYSGSVTSLGLGPVGFPLLSGTVAVSGTAEVGQTLVTDITLLGGSGTISYQWGRGAAAAGPFTAIASATNGTYTLQADDDGTYIAVTVTRAANSGSVTGSPVAGPVIFPALTGSVAITGTAEVGNTLTADITLLGGSGTISYQWNRGAAAAGPFTAIASATNGTYTLQSADNGKYITVTVTRAANSGSVTGGPTGQVPFTFDSAGIQARIDALPSTGGTVILPAGTYTMTGRVTVGKDVTLTTAAGAAVAMERNASFNYNDMFQVNGTGAALTLSTGGSGATLTLDGKDVPLQSDLPLSLVRVSGTYPLTIDAGVTLKDNEGPGVYIRDYSSTSILSSSSLTMNGGTISGNDTGIEYEGAYLNAAISNATISGNRRGVEMDAFNLGNGTAGVFTMSGTTVSNNTGASFGGGLIIRGNITSTMNDSIISGNTVTSNGGGLYIEGGTFTMSGSSEISGNTAERWGGGVDVGTGSTFTMTGGTISGNTAETWPGGGVYLRGHLIMSGGTIYGSSEGPPYSNTTTVEGAALYNNGATAEYGDGDPILPHTDGYYYYTENTITGRL